MLSNSLTKLWRHVLSLSMILPVDAAYWPTCKVENNNNNIPNSEPVYRAGLLEEDCADFPE